METAAFLDALRGFTFDGAPTETVTDKLGPDSLSGRVRMAGINRHDNVTVSTFA